MAMTANSAHKLSGSIERIVSRSEETSWSVLRIDVNGESRTVVGLMPPVDEGLEIQAEGSWQQHATFGQQFKADSVRVFAPVSRDGIERFLCSGAVHGIGKKFASMIVDRFGDKTLSVIENDSWRLKHLKGVGPKRIEAVRKGVKEYRGRMETMAFLHSKLGPIRAQRVYQKYGDDSKKVIAENPYRIAEDLEGIGFAVADQVAREVGVELDSPMRLRAALLTVLQQSAQQGHTCMPIENCIEAVDRLVGSRDLAAGVIEADNAEQPWHRVLKEGIPHLEMTRFKFLDERIAERLVALRAAEPRAQNLDASKAVPWAADQVRLEFEEGQANAIGLALTTPVSVITGGPGTGKTTILNALLRIFQAKRFVVSLAAPTGRAARRMSESTGQQADTLHRLLEYSPRTGGFLRKRENPLELDILIIDESSMVDLSLMRATLEALPIGARLVCVGDSSQLPSVGPGQVLADVIASGCIPVAVLSKPYRQAANSPIIRNAHRVNAGSVPDLSSSDEAFAFYETRSAEETADTLIQLVCETLPNQGVDPLKELMVLAPMHKGVSGIQRLNDELQSRLNPSPRSSKKHGNRVLAVGDKIMVHRNLRDLGVSNGDIGYVESIDESTKEMRILFDIGRVKFPFSELSAIGLAYVSSVHKAQGSEARVVVITVDNSNSVLLSRKLLYTAITRAKERVILVGQKRAVHIAVSEARAHARTTLLAERITRAFDS